MKIITISREFGSGGRELGRRLADVLGFDYYDREIITAIAQAQGMDEGYVEKALEDHAWQHIPLTYGRSFASSAILQSTQTNLLIEQKKVLDGIARAGKDCVIVGRDADVLLADQKPFSMFVCADLEARIQRCMERAPEGEGPGQEPGDHFGQQMGPGRQLLPDGEHHRLADQGPDRGGGGLYPPLVRAQRGVSISHENQRRRTGRR